MKKATFVKLIKLMKDLSERNLLLTEKLRVIFDDDGVCLYPYDIPIDEIFKALKAEFGEFDDKDDWIGWWCFERDFGKRKDLKAKQNGKVIKLDTPEQLYKFLRKNHEKE